MTRLCFMFLLTCLGMAEGRESAHASDLAQLAPSSVNGAVVGSRLGVQLKRVIGSTRSRKPIPSTSRSPEIRLHDLRLKDRQPLGTMRAPSIQSTGASAAVTGILPGLPLPMVAVVDSPDGAALLTKSPGGQGGRRSQLSDQPPPLSAVSSASDGALAGSPISVAASIASAGQQNFGALLLPFDRHVGAAAFRRAGLMVIVFDSSKPVDLAAVAADPVFGAARYSLLSAGAIMTLPLPLDVNVELVRKPDGWLIQVVKSSPPVMPIPVSAGADGMMLSTKDPGEVVVIKDPILKTDLLVGTVRQGGQNIPTLMHNSRYVLNQTMLGVVVERLADRLEMRTLSDGFVIGEPRGRDPQGSRPPSPQIFFSRTLDLPAVDDAELQRRYKAALTSSASVSPANRRRPRLDAAEAALALGQAREAGQLAEVADQDAPAESQAGRSIFLRAVAAVVDRVPGALALLEDPKIANSDEVAMWRALDLAQREPENADAARVISRCLPLIESYPVNLRDRLIGDAAMSLVLGGGPKDAPRVRALRGGGKVRLAQAILLAKGGEFDRALAVFDGLAADADPVVRTTAAARAIEIRLQLRQIKPAQAADRLDAELLDARMAGDELPLRLRVAALRAQAADWPSALAALREVSTSFPDASAQVQKATADVIGQMTGTGASASPTPDIVQLGLIENNLDLLPAGPERIKVSIELARRLVELDLPERASAFINEALAHTTSVAERARLGLELARLRLDQADPTGALTELDTTATAGLPPDLSDARTIMQARAETAAGRIDSALATLGPLQGPEVDDLRASELAIKQDWRGETNALASLVAHEVPAKGQLSGPMEDLVLRLVAATARSGDQDALRQLALTWHGRFTTQTKLDLLRLLTSDSVKTEADLARSEAEIPVSQSALAGLSTAPAKGGG